VKFACPFYHQHQPEQSIAQPSYAPPSNMIIFLLCFCLLQIERKNIIGRFPHGLFKIRAITQQGFVLG
jgi:hypothetical protein